MNWNWNVVMEALQVIGTEGVRMTLELSALGILFGSMIGILIGLLRSQKVTNPLLKVLYGLATGYVELMRGTPFLVQLFLVHYGVPLFTGNRVHIPEFVAGVLALSLNSGAYVSEIIRAGIQSIDKGQMEAGRSLGLTFWQTMRYIILPQALKRALPPLGNEFITLIKESSVVMVIGIQEITMKARIVGSSNYAPFEPMFVSALMYLVLTFICGRIVSFMERRLKTGDQH